ncbi:MAG: redoxin family protein [Bacteroidota bacterium]
MKLNHQKVPVGVAFLAAMILLVVAFLFFKQGTALKEQNSTLIGEIELLLYNQRLRDAVDSVKQRVEGKIMKIQRIPAVRNRTVDLREVHRVGAAVLLLFSTRQCNTCIGSELEALEFFYSRFGKKQLFAAVLGQADDMIEMTAISTAHSVQMPIAFDSAGAVSKQLGLDLDRIPPTYLFLNKDARVVYVYVSQKNRSAARSAFFAKVSTWLAEKPKFQQVRH